MDTKLLRAIVASTQPMVLQDPQEIDLFHSLLRQGLVSGECQTSASGERVVAVHGPTPDGRALLALQNYLNECEGGHHPAPAHASPCR